MRASDGAAGAAGEDCPGGDSPADVEAPALADGLVPLDAVDADREEEDDDEDVRAGVDPDDVVVCELLDDDDGGAVGGGV
jgi:hypothetical protein